MKKMALSVVLTIALTSSIFATPVGVLFSSVKEPVIATTEALGSKKASGTLTQIFGIGFGDAKIEAIAQSTGIKKISHVDKETVIVAFGLFTQEKYTVYGE